MISYMCFIPYQKAAKIIKGQHQASCVPAGCHAHVIFLGLWSRSRIQGPGCVKTASSVQRTRWLLSPFQLPLTLVHDSYCSCACAQRHIDGGTAYRTESIVAVVAVLYAKQQSSGAVYGYIGTQAGPPVYAPHAHMYPMHPMLPMHLLHPIHPMHLMHTHAPTLSMHPMHPCTARLRCWLHASGAGCRCCAAPALAPRRTQRASASWTSPRRRLTRLHAQSSGSEYCLSSYLNVVHSIIVSFGSDDGWQQLHHQSSGLLTCTHSHIDVGVRYQ